MINKQEGDLYVKRILATSKCQVALTNAPSAPVSPRSPDMPSNP